MREFSLPILRPFGTKHPILTFHFENDEGGGRHMFVRPSNGQQNKKFPQATFHFHSRPFCPPFVMAALKLNSSLFFPSTFSTNSRGALRVENICFSRLFSRIPLSLRPLTFFFFSRPICGFSRFTNFSTPSNYCQPVSLSFCPFQLIVSVILLPTSLGLLPAASILVFFSIRPHFFTFILFPCCQLIAPLKLLTTILALSFSLEGLRQNELHQQKIK